MGVEEILDKIKVAVSEGEEDDAVCYVNEAIAMGIDPMIVLNEGAAKGMDIVGQMYNAGEAYLPELVLAGDAMSAILKIIFSDTNGVNNTANKKGTIVIGQAKGDVHDIGKNIVSALLAVNGFELHDLGTDVSVKEFITKAQELNADIIAVSTLLTTSLSFLADTVTYAADSGIRDKVNIIVGGGPVTKEFAASMGADGWSRSALDAVELCKKIMQGKVGGQGDIILVDSEEKVS